MEVFYETYLNNLYGMLFLDALGFGIYFLTISFLYKKQKR